MIYSVAQKVPVASAESECVWYDYERFGKCEGPKDMVDLVKAKMM